MYPVVNELYQQQRLQYVGNRNYIVSRVKVYLLQTSTVAERELVLFPFSARQRGQVIDDQWAVLYLAATLLVSPRPATPSRDTARHGQAWPG